MFQHLFGKSTIADVTAEEAQARQKAGAILVDVREVSEWQAGHIPGAIHIPLGSLQQRINELDSTREIVTVCHSGSRSAVAARMLQKAGFSQVSNLAGGMIGWTRRRLPVRR
jgi:rhodanese-related sulfurtransferase